MTGLRSRRFHRCASRVEPLTDDSAAVTFTVPAALAEEFAFAPGQSLTVRRGEERRGPTPSARRPADARRGSASGRCAGGAVSGWLVHQVRPGDVVEVQAPSRQFTPDLDRPRAPRAHRRGLRHHARCCPSPARCSPRETSRPSRCSTATGAATRSCSPTRSPTSRTPTPRGSALVHVLSPRAAGGRAVQRPARRRQAPRAAAGHRRRRRRGPLVAVRAVSHGRATPSRCSPSSACRGGGSTASCSASRTPRPPRPRTPRRPRARAPRSPSCSTAAAAPRPSRRAPRCSTAPSGSGRTCRSPARAACAAPAGPCSSRARSTMRRNYALEQDELDAGYILTCQSLPAPRQRYRRLRRLASPYEPVRSLDHAGSRVAGR